MSTWIVGKDAIKRHCQTKCFFNSNLKMDDITYTDYKYPRRVDFRIENLGEYYDLSC